MRIETSLPRSRPRNLFACATALVLAISAAGALVFPSTARAITAEEILTRARTWTQTNVPYSQRRWHEGYRTDCSGFVSMAWELESSYTTRTIGSKAVSVPLDELQPGDAVLTPGHVVIFAGWTDNTHSSFISLEEANGRLGSVERVRDLASNARGLRYGGLTEETPAPPEPPAAEPVVEDAADVDLLEDASDLLSTPHAARASYLVEQTVNVGRAK